MADNYDELLINALIKYKEMEFSHVPKEEDIEHVFSDKYIKRKEKLLKNLDHSYWKFINTAAKKVAVILITLIIAFSSLMTVDAFRETVLGFLFKVYSTFTEIEPTNTAIKEHIETTYAFSTTPNTYTEKFCLSNDYLVTSYWSNKKGQRILLTQNLITNSHGFNSEHGELSEAIINDTPCLICKNDVNYFCYWEFDGYRFELVYPTDLGEEFMSQVVGKLVEIDPEALNQYTKPQD